MLLVVVPNCPYCLIFLQMIHLAATNGFAAELELVSLYANWKFKIASKLKNNIMRIVNIPDRMETVTYGLFKWMLTLAKSKRTVAANLQIDNAPQMIWITLKIDKYNAVVKCTQKPTSILCNKCRSVCTIAASYLLCSDWINQNYLVFVFITCGGCFSTMKPDTIRFCRRLVISR